MDHVLEVAGEEHQVLSEVDVVVLFENRKEASDEMGSIKQHLFL
jgi:hypothetical protein